MEEKKLTDEDIIRALENKSMGYGAGIVGDLYQLTLDLINRLQAENETLKSKKFGMWKVKFYKAQEELDKEYALRLAHQFACEKKELEKKQLELENLELRKQVIELTEEWADSVTVDEFIEKIRKTVKETTKEVYDWLKSKVITMEIPHGGEPAEADVEAVMWWQIEEHFKKHYGVEVKE